MGVKGKKRYDADTSPHGHLICDECGTIRDIHISLSMDIKEKNQHGFEIRRSSLNFHGICFSCKEKKEARI